MEFKIIKKLNYAGEMNIRQYEITIEFYTKKQMKTIYPNKNYRVSGYIGNKTGVQCGAAVNLDGKLLLPVYKEKTHNKVTEAVVGYTAVDDNIFLAVVKNVLIQRVITFLIIIVLLSGGITAAVNYQTWFG